MLAKLEEFTLEKTQFSPFFLFFLLKKQEVSSPKKSLIGAVFMWLLHVLFGIWQIIGILILYVCGEYLLISSATPLK